MATLQQTIDRHGTEVLAHLDRQIDVPICDRLGRQGDVIVIRFKGKRATTAVPAQGVPVVRGENGGNTHLLLADGDVTFDGRTASASDLRLGILTVAKKAVAYLAHPEHGYIGFGPGTYEIRRQREQADELRMVQD